MRFEGLTVLVTGATGGFGRRLCERLAADGARLVLSDVAAGPLDELAASLPVESVVLAGDISEEALSENLVALGVQRFGGLDIAINNAGIAQSFVRLPQVPSDEARRIIEEAHRTALETLAAHRDQLEALARALLERETLDELDAYRIAGIQRDPVPEPSL